MCSPFCGKKTTCKENLPPPTLLTSAAPPLKGKADGSASDSTKALKELKYMLASRTLSVGDFAAQKALGQGSFGRVHLVKIKGSPEKNGMALKTMSKAAVIEQSQVEHVLSETKILSMIDHPFIVNMVACFQDQENLHLLLEFCNGGELFSYLDKFENGIPNDHARFYASEITSAFQGLHSLMIAYRDLKPENLLVDSFGHIKVTDLGFAKIVEDRTWTVCGTPEYMAPEIIQSKGHGVGVDWWALGVLIYEMVCGYPPFCHDDTFIIYKKALEGKIDFPSHMDKAAIDLVKRLLKKEPQKRLGCLKNGAEDVMRHNWFIGMSWEELMAREISPPFVPSVSGPDDASMFEGLEDEQAKQGRILSQDEQALFQSFGF